MLHFNWTVQNMIRNVSDDGVVLVEWYCFGFDTPYQDYAQGVVEFNPDPNSASFTAYENLTESQVLQWVYDSGVDKDEIEQTVAAKIQEQKQPSKTAGIPWLEQQEPKP